MEHKRSRGGRGSEAFRKLRGALGSYSLQAVTLACWVLVSSPAVAQVLEFHPFSGVNSLIPDGSLSGLIDTRQIESQVSSITEVKVSLTISGATSFNGDLYAYVTHDTGLAVLLNRPGRTGSNPFGYDDSGVNAVFQDLAANGDVHNYRITLFGDAETPLPSPGVLAGIWSPDGRDVLPSAVTDTSARTALLDSFAGQNASGTWTLFVADVSAGGTATLESWALELSGVPEPVSTSLVTGLVLLGLALFRKLRRTGD